MIYPTLLIKIAFCTVIVFIASNTLMSMQRKTPPPPPSSPIEEFSELGFTWLYRPSYEKTMEQNIAGMSKPVTKEHMVLLERLGITHIVSLSQEPLDPDIVAGRRCHILHLPMDREEAPTEAQTAAFLEFIGNRSNPIRIALHCEKGNARVSTMLAFYLLTIQQLSLSDALRFVQEIRPDKIQPNEVQHAFLQACAQNLGLDKPAFS